MIRFVVACVLALVCALGGAVADAEAGGFVVRRSLFAPIVVRPRVVTPIVAQPFVVQPFVQQRFVAPLIVPQVQSFVVPQVQTFFAAPQVQSFSTGGCGSLFIRGF